MSTLVGGSPQSRTREGIAGVGNVQVEPDAGVVARVQAGTDGAGRGAHGAGAADAQVQALRVVLGAVVGAGAVQGDDLVAQDVGARGQVAGDREARAEVVADEGVGDPGRAADDGALADLGPAEAAGGGLAWGMLVTVPWKGGSRELPL